MHTAVVAAYAALVQHRFQDFVTLLDTCDALQGQNTDFVIRDSGGFELEDFETVPGQKYRNLLACAVDMGDLEVATFLLDNGANPNTRDWHEYDGRTLLEYFVGRPDAPNAAQMFALLVRRGANPHELVDHGGEAGASVWTELQRVALTNAHAAALRDTVSIYVSGNHHAQS
jgi:hypothetical protein